MLSYPPIIIDDTMLRVENRGKVFVQLCNASEISEGKGRKIQYLDNLEMQVAVFRVNGQLYALSNICPHKHADRIFEGIIIGNEVTCPLHGWTYSIQTGENIDTHKGIKSLEKFEIYEENGKVYLEQMPDKKPLWMMNTED